MNSNRILLLSALMAAGLGTRAIGADIEFESNNGVAIRFHHATPEVIIHQGVTPIELKDGITPLDKARTINCRNSSGCLVTAAIWVRLNGGNVPTLSAYVDGVAMNPPSEKENTVEITAQQSALVSLGKHTIQSALTQEGPNSAVAGWQVEYCKYDRHR